MKSMATLFLLLTAPALAITATIEVPGDYSKIQEAVDAASSGDTVLVYPGEYWETVAVIKEIHLISLAGPEVTIIDGRQQSSVVTFQQHPGTNTVLEGFTIMNGKGISSTGQLKGGGISILNCSPTIRKNIIESNPSLGLHTFGGGIFINGGSPVIENNVIRNNTGWERGGAIYSWGSYTAIRNNLIYDNSADYGGGLYLGTHATEVTNNTIWGNSAALYGGGIHDAQYITDVKNCIIRNNTAGSGGNEIQNNSTTITVTYCNVKGGWPGTGNIAGSAQFFNAGLRDFHLKQAPCQPGVVNICVNAGDPSTPMFDGTTRTDGVKDTGIIDMGYHYYAPKTYHVPGDYFTIQQAIDAALPSDTIIVGPGTYYENVFYRGKSVTVKSSHGSAATVINGMQTGSCVAFMNREIPGAVLTGFSLTNGDGTKLGGTPHYYYGGGIFIYYASPTITDNRIHNNNVTGGHGGGICLRTRGSPVIANNIISNNTADLSGGGIDIRGVTISTAHPTVYYNIITHNETKEQGGGINFFSEDEEASIEGNYIAFNSADLRGGGMYLRGISKVADNTICENSAGATFASGQGGGVYFQYFTKWFENNLIYSNEVWGGSNDGVGGGLYVNSCNFELLNCTVTANSADFDAGGMHINSASANLKIKNSIFWNNTAPSWPEIKTKSIITVTYSDIKGGWSGTGNINADPLFFNAATNNYRLEQHPCQPGITNPCVDAGDPSSIMIVGSTRADAVQDSGVVDMGFHYAMSLTADAETVPITGGTVNLNLMAGEHNQLRSYIILGSVTGTSPGFPLPGGYVTLPLNWDPFTDLMFNLLNSPVFKDFLGSLDGEGNAEAQLNTPPLDPVAMGLIMYYAYTMNNPFDFVSNAITVEVVP